MALSDFAVQRQRLQGYWHSNEGHTQYHAKALLHTTAQIKDLFMKADAVPWNILCKHNAHYAVSLANRSSKPWKLCRTNVPVPIHAANAIGANTPSRVKKSRSRGDKGRSQV